MSHVLVFKNDYGHTIQVLVEEYDEDTGLSAGPADLSLYTSKTIVMKKPNDEIVYLTGTPVTGSGIDGWLQTIVPSGSFTVNGYYNFDVLLQNALQKFHSTEFGFDVTVSIEQ